MATQAPTGVWLGQDGHDLVGHSFTPGPDGIQDIHIALSGLPEDLTVTKADILPYGGGEWMYKGPPGSWAAGWVQDPGSTTADLYVDPYMVETGRTFTIFLTYSDGSVAQVDVAGGAATPLLRMPSYTVNVAWNGQNGQDLTGPSPDVGPDGVQDVDLALGNLNAKTAVSAITVSTPSGLGWAFGTNPNLLWNAELVRSTADPSRADLFFNPVAGLAGQTMTVTINYADGSIDQTTLTAGAADPSLRMPPPVPTVVSWPGLGSTWLGQDGQDPTAMGQVHVALTGLPAGRTVVSAALSDDAHALWAYSAARTPNPNAMPLTLVPSSSVAGAADLFFQPQRNEAGATLTLTLVLDDGTTLAAHIAGGASDPGRIAPQPAKTSIDAKPGDDLSALVEQYGTIHLTAGTYNLSQPLVLDRPVTITADPGTTLLFSQPAGDAGWNAAIVIECGHTTLQGFAVRFAGPVQWAAPSASGPSVIGSADNYDGGPRTPLVGLTFSHLDLQSPPPVGTWEEAPHLIFLTNALSGSITDNILKGGTTEFQNGPWVVTGNNYQGALPNTFSYQAFAGHYTHDTVIANNVVQPVGESGKTWRFLVMTGAGYNDRIANNVVSGVGPMDSDTVANPNAPEIMLTESYRLNYEGAPAAISPDGWVVQIPTPQGGPAYTGDVVSILSGPDAGQWRIIAQALSATSYLLDAPISPGDTAVSISRGFVNETFQGNTIDARGSSTAFDLVLAGNHFGTKVLNNQFVGGYEGLNLLAAPTEAPDIWGWSHAPFLGGVIAGNTLVDTVQGAVLDVQHDSYIKSDVGRTYMSVSLDNNTVAWSASFLAARAQAGQTALPATFTVGSTQSADPGELQIEAHGNTVINPPGQIAGGTWRVNSATLNGQAISNQSLALSTLTPGTAPSGLGLTNDTGASARDGITNDGHVQFSPVAGASGYEYSLSGGEGTYLPLSSSAPFLPAGLVQGVNTVYIRAFDADGNRGAAASFSFAYDTVAPGPVTGLVAEASGQVMFLGVTGDTYEYRIGTTGPYTPLGSVTAFTTADLLSGTRTVQVHAVDTAGNVGAETLATITPQWVPVLKQPAPAPVPAPVPVTVTVPVLPMRPVPVPAHVTAPARLASPMRPAPAPASVTAPVLAARPALPPVAYPRRVPRRPVVKVPRPSAVVHGLAWRRHPTPFPRVPVAQQLLAASRIGLIRHTHH
jgi:hypothetical protein